MVFFKSLTKEVLNKYTNRIFIETGTQHGLGIEVALECGFEKIYSIDLESKYHYECTKKFSSEISSGRVELLIGDSALKLKDILEKIDEPATFWLDAHSDGGLVGVALCPVIYELKQIANHLIKTHSILVDDRRMFGIYWGVGTSEKDVVEAIMQVNPNYKIIYENGCEPNDIIAAYV